MLFVAFILTFLIGCSKEASTPIINKDMPVYVTYEIGPNFVSHIWSVSAEKNIYEKDLAKKISRKHSEMLPHWYDFIYTHKFDYLWPQIFYYIPMGNNFDSQEIWKDYFNNWALAIENREISFVEFYFEDTSLKAYMTDIFENTSDRLWQEIYLNQIEALKKVEEIYLDAFKDYEKKIWPEVSHLLHRKMFAINEGLAQLSLLERWEKETKLEFLNQQYKFTLVYIQPDDFEYIHVDHNTFVIPMELFKDPYDYIEYMSQRLGYTLLVQEEDFLSDIYQDNKYLMKHFDVFEVVNEVVEFITAQYNNIIMGYETDIYVELLEKDPNFHALKWKFIPLKSASSVLKEHLIVFIEALKIDIPLEKNGSIYYNRTPYENFFEKDDWSLHYGPGQPLIEKNHSELLLFTDLPTSKPIFYLEDNKLAFIMPYERNAIGNIYLMDLDEKEPYKITSLDAEDDETIKYLAFNSMGELYAIKGHAFGSFSLGGLLYKVDLDQGKFIEINVPLENKEEIVSIHRDNQTLYVRIIKMNPSYRVDSDRRFIIKE
jgi:hypothetical protein